MTTYVVIYLLMALVCFVAAEDEFRSSFPNVKLIHVVTVILGLSWILYLPYCLCRKLMRL